MRQQYNNFEQIELDLKRLKLERQIALEELKAVKHDFAEDLKPLNWVQTVVAAFSKFGMFMLFKKMFTKNK